MNVYLLGAGASKSYETSKNKVKLPLAKDFFKTFNQLEIAKNGWILVGALVEYVKETRGVNPFEFASFNEDIELLHSEIQEKYLDAIQKQNFIDIFRYGQAFSQLVFLFCSVINETQNGPESIFHKNLVHQLDDDDTIITFNWDTLIDKSLANSKRWSSETGYGISPQMIYRDRWEINNQAKSKNILLKLHGSTNWISSYINYDYQEKRITFTHDGPCDLFYVYENCTKPYPCYDGRFMSGYEDFSMGYYPPNILNEEYSKNVPEGHVRVRSVMRIGNNPRGESSDDGIVSMPVIIPPVKNKSYDFYGELFPTLWGKAEEALVNADKIYILGYSFPITDIASKELFSKAFCKRKSIPDVIIINPMPDSVYDRFKFDLGIPANKIKIYKDYITQNYQIIS